MRNMIVYDSDGQVIPGELMGRSLVINQADFSLGRAFIIEYDNPLNNQSLLNLGYSVYDESLELEGSLSGVCEIHIR